MSRNTAIPQFHTKDGELFILFPLRVKNSEGHLMQSVKVQFNENNAKQCYKEIIRCLAMKMTSNSMKLKFNIGKTDKKYEIPFRIVGNQFSVRIDNPAEFWGDWWNQPAPYTCADCDSDSDTEPGKYKFPIWRSGARNEYATFCFEDIAYRHDHQQTMLRIKLLLSLQLAIRHMGQYVEPVRLRYNHHSIAEINP